MKFDSYNLYVSNCFQKHKLLILGSFLLCTEEKFLQLFNEDGTSRGTLQTFLHEERRTVWSRRHVAKMFWKTAKMFYFIILYHLLIANLLYTACYMLLICKSVQTTCQQLRQVEVPAIFFHLCHSQFTTLQPTNPLWRGRWFSCLGMFRSDYPVYRTVLPMLPWSLLYPSVHGIRSPNGESCSASIDLPTARSSGLCYWVENLALQIHETFTSR